jgi:UDP-N-acetylmuramoyl-L-alanyl-D-glutamate--2,6-diaminopimelate ligase
MRLSVLLKDYLTISPDDDRDIAGLALDSRAVKPGDLFFAYPGTHSDGRDYIQSARAKGAIAVVVEADNFIAENNFPDLAIFKIPQLALEVGHIAARFYDYPSRHMQVIGITGTNGKTSCCHFIAQALQKNGIACGVMGTIGNGVYDAKGYRAHPANLTTPDAISVQALLAAWRAQGVKIAALEAASHGLAQGRLQGVEFMLGVFTNLTRDHLDYHGDMASYAKAKRRLFACPNLRYAVFNSDDATGRQWARELTATHSVFVYSLQLPTLINKAHAGKSTCVQQAQFDTVGITAAVHTPWGEGVLGNSHLIGRFNLSNQLAVLTVLGILKIPLPAILAGLAQVGNVPGRMQVVRVADKPLAVIDYAHTPDALEQALRVLREHCRGQLWCVLGCGGERDRGKRPLMGKIAEQYADRVVVTDDNPRHENPRQIVAEILQGMVEPERAVVEHDRRRAIAHAVNGAQGDDVILIAGKGHETYQIMGAEKLAFSDVSAAQLLLNAKE